MVWKFCEIQKSNGNQLSEGPNSVRFYLTVWGMACIPMQLLLLLIHWLLLLPLFVWVLCLSLVLLCSTLIVSFLVLQSSCWGREGWLLYFNRLSNILWLLVCHGLVCSVWLCYFLVILTFWVKRYTFCNLESLEFFNDFELIMRH